MLKQRSSLLTVLLSLSLLSIFAQVLFYLIHYHTTELLDALVSSSLPKNFFHWVVLGPLLGFLLIQVAAYFLLVGLLWFMAFSCGQLFKCSPYFLGVLFWCLGLVFIFSANSLWFPHSFFASVLPFKALHPFFFICSALLLGLGLVLAYLSFFKKRQQPFLAFLYLLLALSFGLAQVYQHYQSQPHYLPLASSAQPNIILIGLDSLRPDFTGYAKEREVRTPTIDAFLKSGFHFKEAYTPLARTFPAWISILTGRHPKNNLARINLNSPLALESQPTLAKAFQKAGYATLYATDEKRFSNLTTAYGFDQVLGPAMGLGDFLLGGLSDFPLTNLLINSPLGPLLFPYNYANRAAAITYEPDSFLQQLRLGLRQRPSKPLFLAVHFCLPHWPFTWAEAQGESATLDQRYLRAVEKVDLQLASFLQVLKENGLLEHSLVVLLSDHGTTLGLPQDRIISKENYQGDPKKMKWLSLYKKNTAPKISVDLQQDYSLDTSYGQGTDILSLKQYQIVLAFKGYGLPIKRGSSLERVSLLDLAPTLLDFGELAYLPKVDGSSLYSLMKQEQKKKTRALPQRPLFLETGYSIADLESKDIAVEKVVKNSIQLYQLNPQTGYLFVDPRAEKAVLDSKQRALILGPWLLARYPQSYRPNLSAPSAKAQLIKAYYVLVNLNTGEWTLDFKTPLAKKAPLASLRQQFRRFYGEELNS